MAADGLATQGAWVSADLTLNKFPKNITGSISRGFDMLSRLDVQWKLEECQLPPARSGPAGVMKNNGI